MSLPTNFHFNHTAIFQPVREIMKYRRFLKTIYPIYIPLLASVERTNGKAVVALIISWQKTPEERIESGKA